MIARLHFATSLLFSYLIYFSIINLDRFSSIALAIFTAKISTIPDFDYKIFSWANKQIIFLKNTKFYVFLFPYYMFLKFLLKIFKHRGVTHSIYPILIFIFMKFIFSNVFLIFALSFTLHMVEDIVTPSGIQPFYPLNNFRISIPVLNNKNRNFQTFLSILLLILFFIIVLS